MDRLPVHCFALVLRHVLRSSQERRRSEYHWRTRSTRRQRADVLVAVPADVAGRGAWWLDRRARRLQSSVHHQRALVFCVGVFRVARAGGGDAQAQKVVSDEPRSLYRGYWSDMREGWSYIVTHAPVATILGINILWATGGGAMNLIADRLGALVFAGENGISPDSAVAAFYFAGGFGLFIGMMIARRVGAFFELRKRTVAFIGWSLFIQGIFYALAGVMPTLVWACVMVAISRVLLGAEFAVQETLLMRLVPDHLRGRVSTSDRAAEMMIWAFSTAIAGWSLHWINARTLTVISGLLSGTAGILWLVLFVTRKVRLPKKVSGHRYTQVAAD